MGDRDGPCVDVFWQVRFKNKGNSRHYDYKAFATLFKEDYLLGTWTSRYPGGTNRGAFILTFVTDGEFLCGYWVGRDRRGANRYGRWVLSKKEAGLAEAKKTLGDMRMPNPHWASVGRFPPVQILSFAARRSDGGRIDAVRRTRPPGHTVMLC